MADAVLHSGLSRHRCLLEAGVGIQTITRYGDAGAAASGETPSSLRAPKVGNSVQARLHELVLVGVCGGRRPARHSQLDEDVAHQITSMLMNDALKNLQVTNHKQALTGPLQRGDTTVIKQHLYSLDSVPKMKMVYSVLGQAIIPITEHPKKLKDDLYTLLGQLNFK